MPGIDTNNASLSVASQTGLGLQDIALKKQQINQQAIEKAGQPIQEAATDALKQQLDMVTITPQMAAGLKTVTGDDSWNRAVGTKWKSNVFSAITTAQAQSKYHNDLMNNRDLLEKMREEAAASRLGERDEDKKALAKLMTEQKEELLAWEKAHGVTSTGNKPGSGKSGGGGSSTKDLQAQKALLAEQHNKQAVISNPFADDKDKADARKWLDDNKADIDQAIANMKTSAGVKLPAASGPGTPAASSGTAATIPLDNKLPGLD